MIEQKYSEFKKFLSPFVYKDDFLSKIIFINFLVKGNLLIEDLPGSGKTMLSMAIAKIFWFEFQRIHATSDLLPQDIIWGEYFNVVSKNIEIKKGPIFTELLLVDEINRMNPKTQSAFLQAMEEKKVSLAWKDFDLWKYFCVIATQNPIEYSWTFVLPEAQKDRFFAKISLWSPNSSLQKEFILNNTYETIKEEVNSLSSLFEKEELDTYYSEIKKITISEEIAKKLVIFFENIKKSDKILYPLSQRWISIFLLSAKANAFISGRNFVIPEDFYEIIPAFLWHRLDIEKTSFDIIENLFKDAFKHF